MIKINERNFEGITQHYINVITKAIGIRPITSEEMELTMKWDLYKAKAMEKKEMIEAIKKYCGQ